MVIVASSFPVQKSIHGIHAHAPITYTFVPPAAATPLPTNAKPIAAPSPEETIFSNPE
eukprot:Pgem_evm1s5354